MFSIWIFFQFFFSVLTWPIFTQAMILAGSAGDQVRVVEPPAGSAVGDVLFLQVFNFLKIPFILEAKTYLVQKNHQGIRTN